MNSDETASVNYPVAIPAIFIWIGFLGAISFMESWLKFLAPGITVELGLGIGKLVFNGLNKIEWAMAFAIIANLLWVKEKILSRKNRLILVPISCLLLQTFWLLPALDLRADLVIQGHTLPHSNLHYYYVGLEIIKLSCLFIIGIRFLRISKNRQP
jgi:hypothetical protein